MNRQTIINKLQTEVIFYRNWIELHGNKIYSESIYNGYKIKSTYREVITQRYNALGIVNIDSTTQVIETFLKGLIKLNKSLDRMF